MQTLKNLFDDTLSSLDLNSNFDIMKNESLKRIENGHYQGIDSSNQTWKIKKFGSNKWIAVCGSSLTISFPSRIELRTQLEILFGKLSHPG